MRCIHVGTQFSGANLAIGSAFNFDRKFCRHPLVSVQPVPNVGLFYAAADLFSQCCLAARNLYCPSKGF